MARLALTGHIFTLLNERGIENFGLDRQAGNPFSIHGEVTYGFNGNSIAEIEIFPNRIMVHLNERDDFKELPSNLDQILVDTLSWLETELNIQGFLYDFDNPGPRNDGLGAIYHSIAEVADTSPDSREKFLQHTITICFTATWLSKTPIALACRIADLVITLQSKLIATITKRNELMRSMKMKAISATRKKFKSGKI